jgi:hypothetical protein
MCQQNAFDLVLAGGAQGQQSIPLVQEMSGDWRANGHHDAKRGQHRGEPGVVS